ncbi:hypothetical protein FKP32DRAFT_1604834 [Trametes sanguinea]|nr:hypothetical protein FKP32DRAFT_1604834 [Trametes sanguinea]
MSTHGTTPTSQHRPSCIDQDIRSDRTEIEPRRLLAAPKTPTREWLRLPDIHTPRIHHHDALALSPTPLVNRGSVYDWGAYGYAPFPTSSPGYGQYPGMYPVVGDPGYSNPYGMVGAIHVPGHSAGWIEGNVRGQYSSGTGPGEGVQVTPRRDASTRSSSVSGRSISPARGAPRKKSHLMSGAKQARAIEGAAFTAVSEDAVLAAPTSSPTTGMDILVDSSDDPFPDDSRSTDGSLVVAVRTALAPEAIRADDAHDQDITTTVMSSTANNDMMDALPPNGPEPVRERSLSYFSTFSGSTHVQHEEFSGHQAAQTCAEASSGNDAGEMDLALSLASRSASPTAARTALMPLMGSGSSSDSAPHPQGLVEHLASMASEGLGPSGPEDLLGLIVETRDRVDPGSNGAVLAAESRREQSHDVNGTDVLQVASNVVAEGPDGQTPDANGIDEPEISPNDVLPVSGAPGEQLHDPNGVDELQTLSVSPLPATGGRDVQTQTRGSADLDESRDSTAATPPEMPPATAVRVRMSEGGNLSVSVHIQPDDRVGVGRGTINLVIHVHGGRSLALEV